MKNPLSLRVEIYIIFFQISTCLFPNFNNDPDFEDNNINNFVCEFIHKLFVVLNLIQNPLFIKVDAEINSA